MADGYNPTIAPTVLGSGTQPLQFLMQRRQFEDQQAQREAVLRQRQQERRNDQIDKLMQIQPDKAWEPYDREIKQQANMIRAWTVQELAAGRDPFDPRFMAQLAGMKDRMNTTASGSMYLKELFTNKFKEIDDNPNLKKKYYKDLLNRMVFGEDGITPLNLNEVDFDKIRKITDDANGYDIDYIGRNFVDKLPEIITKYYTKRYDEGGGYYDITEKKRNVLRSPDINPETGTYDINITDDVLLMAKEHPYLSKALEQFKEQTGIKDDKQALGQILGKYAPDVSVQTTPGRRIPKDEGDKKQLKLEELADRRVDMVYRAVYNNDRDAMAAATNVLDGVTVEPDYAEEKGGPVRIEGLKVTIEQKGTDPATRQPYKPKVYHLKTDTEIGKESVMFQLSQLIDEQQGAAGQKIGADLFRQRLDKYLKERQGGSGGTVYSQRYGGNDKDISGYGDVGKQ